MTQRRLLVLLVVALAAIGAAFWLVRSREAPEAAAHGKVLPALGGSLNSVTELRIVTAGDKSAVTLKRDEKSWRVMERDGHPADAARLRKLLLDLGALAVVEAKTANPQNYSRLGVEDTAAATASGLRIDLLGLPRPLGLIVGKSAGGDAGYVRVSGEAGSLLAKPLLSIEREPRNWLDRSILDIPVERVQQVRVAVPRAKPYEVTRDKREQADFTVAGVPKGRTLSSPSAPHPIAAALAGLSLDDVQRDGAPAQAAGSAPDSAAASGWTGDLYRSEYRLFDGTSVTVTGRKDGERHLIRVGVGFDAAQHARFAVPAAPNAPAPLTPEQVRAAAEALQGRLSGWTYEIPAYKFETLFRPVDDLLSAK